MQAGALGPDLDGFEEPHQMGELRPRDPGGEVGGKQAFQILIQARIPVGAGKDRLMDAPKFAEPLEQLRGAEWDLSFGIDQQRLKACLGKRMR